MTPRLTRTNANSVPMLVSSAEDVDGQDAAGDGADDARDDRRDVGRAEARVNLRRDRREQAVVRHREEDARLPEQHHQHDRREAGDGADLDGRREPQLARWPRRRRAIGCGTLSFCRGRRRSGSARRRCRGPCRSPSETEDADGQVALRVARLLRGRRDGVEPDVREEDHRRALQHAGDAEAAERALVRAGRRGASSRCSRSAPRRR